MSQTPKSRRPKKSGLVSKMRKSHSFGATADLGLSFAKPNWQRKLLNMKDPYRLRLPDDGRPTSRTASDDAESVDSLDFNQGASEVQRLELSEVAAGISRLKHAESNDHISQMDEQSTLSRIEKLFPYDDLELISSSGKKGRRRRSAPSQILLKNFRRSTTVGDVTSSKLTSPDSPAQPSADYVSRKFIFESAVQLTSGVQTQERYLFLFNDLLFIAKQRSATSYKLKNRVLVSDIWLGDSITEVSEVSNLDPRKSIVIGWPTTNYVATFSTKELRDRWENKLKSQIYEEQVKEPATNIDVEVVYKTSSLAEHLTMTLTIDKQTDAKDLLRLTMHSFDIQDIRESDYQLLVVSTKDDSIYPLIGHEQPFAIQLSHDRDGEEIDPNIKCQFILRENKKQMKLADRKPQKSTKKKKLPLSNIFRKSSGKIPSPRSNSISEGKIFGHPLDELCEPDMPTPLMDLLENLYNYGPYTLEIFRKPPHAKRCQEMVKFMNSTEPEGWCDGCHNGFLFASILKTFLRELPGFLCCSEYYNQWLNAINLSKKEDKITFLQKIVEKLPKGNQLLLRYIICILSHIQEKSVTNRMTSYNLAVCLGPSLLWNESSEKSDQEESSKVVPQVVEFLIDNCQSVFGEDILHMFGHAPTGPPDSDTEEAGGSNERINTPYNDSLESLSDTEHPVMGALTQMSPSSCSRDSGLILSDPHEDCGEQSDDHSIRREIVKSKSCDSLSRTDNANLGRAGAPLQTQVSSDSLDCDDEYIELGNDYNYLLTKSRSGGHLYFDKEAQRTPLPPSQKPNERLQSRLASLASRYSESASGQQEAEYSSSDSDKSVGNAQESEWANSELQKSSTSSSIQQGSSSSDDAVAVTHRYINTPTILESESGQHPTDFLHQFSKGLQRQEASKKKLREDLLRITTDKTVGSVNTDTDDDLVDGLSKRQSSTVKPTRASAAPRLKHTNSAKSSNTPRITRTNTYAGRSERRQRPLADVSMVANMAETRPIMPQQYNRPNQPPPYREALERQEKIKAGIPEIERIKQTVHSARAKQMYAKSVQLFAQQENGQSSRSATTDSYSHSTSSSATTTTTTTHSNIISSKPHINDNNNTIGIVNTSDKKFVIKRAPPSSAPIRQHSINADYKSSNIFYQPSIGADSAGLNTAGSSTQPPSNSLASAFFRPNQPPPYKEVMKRRTVITKPDLIDSLGGESLV